MKWAKVQPKDGDPVLVCAHFDIQAPGDLHWFKAGDQWICICAKCEAAYRDDIKNVPIADQRRWTGDEPIIVADPLELLNGFGFADPDPGAFPVPDEAL